MKQTNLSRRKRIHRKIRAKIHGTPQIPRVAFFRSNTRLYAQLIDDTKGHTLLAIDSKTSKSGKTTQGAKKMGETFADQILKKGIKKIIFDRSGYLYHGRVKEFSQALNAKGL